MWAAAPVPAASWDVSVEREVHRYVLHHRWLADLARWLTHLGDPIVVTVATFGLAGLLWLHGRRRAAVGALVIRALAILVVTALKTGIGRSRPVFAHPIATAAGASFPSGHALGAAAFWTTIALFFVSGRRLQVLAASVVPVLIAATRVVLGVHYLSDVVVGLFLGMLVAFGVAWLFGDRSGAVHRPFTHRS